MMQGQGEQPIFTTKAHVFQIDPQTKKKWLPASTQAVNVSYFYDSPRNTYRIISVEGSKAVINSTITPTMTFTKTSQKFGQWTDSKANTVYGLGFTSEADLTMFVEKFKEIKELTRQTSPQPSPPQQSQNGDSNHISQDKTEKLSPQNNINERGETTSASEGQLKYENDRLKLALAQSSSNAKKWEVELTTLKNNNVRLQTALQESTSNVQEWKKQLATYKEDNAKLRDKVSDLQKSGSGTEQMNQQIKQLNDRIMQLETTNRHKEEEISSLSKRVDELRPLEAKNRLLDSQVKAVEQENENLQSKVTSLQDQVNAAKTSQTRERQQLRDLHEQINRKFSEVTRLQEQAANVFTH